ncbi:MAG: YciI family protein [Myxococcales bacterium]|nr:YciI family protein [Myxococcales bacterium]
MLYALLIHEAESIAESYEPDELAAVTAEHGELQKLLKAQSRFVEANQLMPSSSAVTVSVRGGKRMVTDGPYIETKELLIGLYVVDCDDLEQAIEYAARIPSARSGHIEVRPIAYFEQGDPAARG